MEHSVEELIKQAHKLAQSQPLYRYNPQVLEEIIRKGKIPEGAVIANTAGQELVREGNEVVCYKTEKDGSKRVTKRTPIDENMMPRLLVQYAVTAACAAVPPVKMGMIG